MSLYSKITIKLVQVDSLVNKIRHKRPVVQWRRLLAALTSTRIIQEYWIILNGWISHTIFIQYRYYTVWSSLRLHTGTFMVDVRYIQHNYKKWCSEIVNISIYYRQQNQFQRSNKHMVLCSNIAHSLLQYKTMIKDTIIKLSRLGLT